MGQEFNDSEIFADFIIEAKEHLETLEPNLLKLEKAPDNLGLLNDIFRPMHSLKGASGFLGLPKINHLAHKAENILDELRKGTIAVSADIMDAILSSTDALRQMIENIDSIGSEGDVDIDSLCDLLDELMPGGSGGSGAPTAAPTQENHPEDDEYTEANTTEELHTEAAPQPEEIADAEVIADVDDTANNDSGKQKAPMTAREWVDSLPRLDGYALTAFGEGHLRDFMDEARETIHNLTTGLLELERADEVDSEHVNDLFRYFHNMKGNSGIIGLNELNLLTHEAETLLNKIRHGEQEVSFELIDLLLLVVDMTDALVTAIDPAAIAITPFDVSEMLACLQAAVAGERIALPESFVSQNGAKEEAAAQESEEVPTQEETQPQAQGKTETLLPQVADLGLNNKGDDLDAYHKTVKQQMAIIRVALAELGIDASKSEMVDALFRSLVAIQNASKFMEFADIASYSEITAGLVDKAREADMDFSIMLDILSQEVGIIEEMYEGQVKKLREESGEPYVLDAQQSKTAAKPAAVKAEPKAAAPVETKAEAPKAEAAEQPAKAPEAKPEPAKAEAKTEAPKPAPEAKTEAPKPAPAPAAKTFTSASKGGTPKGGPKRTAAAQRAAAEAKAAPVKAADGKPADAENKASSTIRVDHEKLDHLMNLIGELIINRNRYTMLARRLEGDLDTNAVSLIAQDLSETTYAMARISDDLQDTIMKVRMVPVASVFSRFPRLVRDLSRKSGKAVELVLEGEETELDKSVVEVIGDPLVHLIRNAVDHGIESEADRLAKGKPGKGHVTLRAYHRGNSVSIEIEDDGKGLDPEILRGVAVRKGLMSMEEAKLLSDREAMELIFAPGFSSAEQITDISGRGVGMDVVRTNIKNLKGSIAISSELGKGTRFTLSLPLTLAIIDALMITVDNETYAIPLDAVSETTKISPDQINIINDRKAVTLRGEVLGVVELSELIGLPKKEVLDDDELSVVVIHNNERRVGFVVDSLLERQEIVIKPLGSYLGDVRGISGATILGDGSVILILDPHEMHIMATSRTMSTPAVA